MSPLEKLGFALVAFACATLGAAAPAPGGRPDEHRGVGSRELPRLGECPVDSLPDDGLCLSLKGNGESPELSPSKSAHRERSGEWNVYDQIPRRPERPADYDAYRYPIPPGLAGGHSVVSGYDLDMPDERQRRGRMKAIGHGGVDLPQRRGTPVKLVALEHQEGDADVLYVGPLFGNTVITRHAIHESGKLREYIVLFGHLDSYAPGVAAGTTLHDGDLIGGVGDTGSKELVHLHLEVRRVRDGVNLAKVPAGGPLLAESTTVVCDPRNVLPLL